MLQLLLTKQGSGHLNYRCTRLASAKWVLQSSLRKVLAVALGRKIPGQNVILGVSRCPVSTVGAYGCRDSDAEASTTKDEEARLSGAKSSNAKCRSVNGCRSACS